MDNRDSLQLSKIVIDGGAIARSTVSTEKHRWQFENVPRDDGTKFNVLWSKDTHDALKVYRQKRKFAFLLYEHKRNIRARGKKAGKRSVFSPFPSSFRFVQFPCTYKVQHVASRDCPLWRDYHTCICIKCVREKVKRHENSRLSLGNEKHVYTPRGLAW